MADDVTLPDDLFAKSLPAIGASYVNDGVSIRGIDGPILRGVEMTMEITHPSPIESILPLVQPSPRKYWLSSDAATDQEIVFSIATQGEEAHSGSDLSDAATDQEIVFSIATQGEEAHSGSDLIGIALLNCNAQNVRVETLNLGGTWDLRTDIFRAQTGLDYIRDGNTIKPDITTTSVGEYYQRNELAGSYFVANVGTGDARTIIGNTAGRATSSPGPTSLPTWALVMRAPSSATQPATSPAAPASPRSAALSTSTLTRWTAQRLPVERLAPSSTGIPLPTSPWKVTASIERTS